MYSCFLTEEEKAWLLLNDVGQTKNTEIPHPDDDILSQIPPELLLEAEHQICHPEDYDELLSTVKKSPFPLAPGIYPVVPRAWLNKWRASIRDPSKISQLGVLDNTCLLCPMHNKLIVPPHLEEYLNGLRKNLLNGLGQYAGIKVEILAIEEFEELINTIPGMSNGEFVVQFSHDGEGNIHWNIDRCFDCDPLSYDVTVSKAKKKGPNSSNITTQRVDVPTSYATVTGNTQYLY